MLLVVVPEWGHLSPFLHVADSIKRNWDPRKGELQLALASMEQVMVLSTRQRVEQQHCVPCWCGCLTSLCFG
jgi:hypothetical protein